MKSRKKVSRPSLINPPQALSCQSRSNRFLTQVDLVQSLSWQETEKEIRPCYSVSIGMLI
jgi:hypothetical protein